MTTFIIQGSSDQLDEKPVALTVSDGGTRRLRVTVGQSGISRGDFAGPRPTGPAATRCTERRPESRSPDNEPEA